MPLRIAASASPASQTEATRTAMGTALRINLFMIGELPLR
jgi:hypothetical protein